MVQGKEETEGRHGGLGLLGALHQRQHEHELGHERVSETNHDHEHDGGDVIVGSPMSRRPLRVMGVVRLMGRIVGRASVGSGFFGKRCMKGSASYSVPAIEERF